MQKVYIFLAIAALSYLFFKNENMLILGSGIAIFIFGVVIMGEGFKSISGGSLEKFLKNYASTKPKSVLFGLFSTTLMQSSTLISLVTISFLSAGLIDIMQGIGIIFGSQVGTTTGAWLIAGLGVKVDIGKYAMPILVFGVIFLLQSGKNSKSFGKILIGIGFLFLGVAYIKDGFDALGNDFDLTKYSIDGMRGVLLFFLVGIAIAIVTQSSLATIVITITALSAGQVSYLNALGIVIGANLGTTLTGLVSSLGANIEGKRLAVVYLFFNIFICLLSIVFIKQLSVLVNYEAMIFGIDENNYALKLAVFHSTINILGVIALYPLMEKIAWLVQKIVRKKANFWDEEDSVLYINESSANHEDAMREVLKKEICHLYANASKIALFGIHVKLSDTNANLIPKDVIASRNVPLDFDFDKIYQKKIKNIYGQILNFIILAQSNAEDKTKIEELGNMQKAAVNIVESLKDIKHLQKNLVKHMVSENIHLKNEYNHIRENILMQVGVLNRIFDLEDTQDKIELLEQIEIIIKKFDSIAGKSFGSLIKSAKISPLLGASLVNDNAYTHHILRGFADAAKIIFEPKEEDISDAENIGVTNENHKENS